MKQLTEKQAKVLEVIYTDQCKGSLKKAIEVAGYAPGTSVAAVAKGLKEELSEKLMDFLATEAASTAAYTLYKAAEAPENAEALLGLKERIAASKDVLSRAGFSETNKVEVETKLPLFMLPSKDEAK